jgi:Ca2+-binding EF-hand superfamily protein
MCSAVAMAAACSDSKAPPIPQRTAPVATNPSSPSAEVSAAPVESKPVMANNPTEEVVPPADIAEPKTDPAASTAAASPATPNVQAGGELKPEEKSTPERIAILTPGGPLLVDVHITIGGKPLATAFDELVKRVLDTGDSDHDGQATWKELVADRTYLEKEMPKAPAADSRQMKTLIERYDENRDGKIQPGEAAAWLGRDAGSSAKPFAVRSTRAYRPDPRATSQVWQLIDGDGDGQLTNDEIAGASDRLLALDADDDRVLAPTEMASLREQLAAAGQQRPYVAREANHYAVMQLGPQLDIERLQYLLSDLYAPQQDLGPSSFSGLSKPYQALDANGDGWFDGDELGSIRTVAPHMRLEVAFSEAADEKPGVVAIEVNALTPEVEIVARPAADRAVVALGSTRLMISAHQLAAKPDAEPNTGQAASKDQVRLMVHDQVDALFEVLDSNADGRLGEREISQCSQRLAERDNNGDRQLAGDEFPYSMVVAFLRGEAANERSFYVPPSAAVLATKSDKAPAASWFTHADLNGDGDVSRREFLGSGEQFDRIDANKDGYIGPLEAAL